MDQGDGGNHQIRRRNGDALLKEAAPNLAELLGAGEIEIEYLHVDEQVGNSLQQRRRVRNMVGARIQLAENNGGNEQPAALFG